MSINQSDNHSLTQSVCTSKLLKVSKLCVSRQGFSEEVLSVLRKTSKTTSDEQLRTVLQEAQSRGHIQRADTRDMTEKVIADLDDPDSELRIAMIKLEPLQYV
jgi:hypothetical protein